MDTNTNTSQDPHRPAHRVTSIAGIAMLVFLLPVILFSGWLSRIAPFSLIWVLLLGPLLGIALITWPRSIVVVAAAIYSGFSCLYGVYMLIIIHHPIRIIGIYPIVAFGFVFYLLSNYNRPAPKQSKVYITVVGTIGLLPIIIMFLLIRSCKNPRRTPEPYEEPPAVLFKQLLYNLTKEEEYLKPDLDDIRSYLSRIEHLDTAGRFGWAFCDSIAIHTTKALENQEYTIALSTTALNSLSDSRRTDTAGRSPICFYIEQQLRFFNDRKQYITEADSMVKYTRLLFQIDNHPGAHYAARKQEYVKELHRLDSVLTAGKKQQDRLLTTITPVEYQE